MTDRDPNEPLSELGQEALHLHVMFSAFVEGGFTEDQAKAVREATDRVDNWGADTVMDVQATMPQVAVTAGHEPLDWCVTVETQRRDWETPVMAAARVATWVTLHAERWGKVPTELAIQRTTEQEKAVKPFRDRHSW